MSVVRIALRLAALCALLILGALITFVMTVSRGQDAPSNHYKRIRQGWFKHVARCVGVKVTIQGAPCTQPALWISNHISWLDIPIIGSTAPVGFLSKAEVLDWPMIGWLAKQAGTLFIVRGAKDASARAASDLQNHLQADHSIVLFPEGTTSNGEALLRFHARPLAPALSGQLLIQPVAIRYLEADGRINQDVPYIGEDTLLKSVKRVLGRAHIQAEIIFLAPVNAADFKDRKSLANHLQQAIAATLYPNP